MENKSVCVTGSSRGLGKQLALQFSKNYDVIIHGRDKEKLQEVYRLCCGPSALPNKKNVDIIEGDVRDPQVLDSLVEISKRRGLDILVNNAGIYHGSSKEIMDVNVSAVIDLTERILPIFKEKKSGLIVNINSIAGKQGGSGNPAYHASKHALRGYFNSLRFNVTKDGIRILDIYPGGIDTQMTDWREDQKLLMDPEEVAKVIVKNCELYRSLGVNEISIGRRHYEK